MQRSEFSSLREPQNSFTVQGFTKPLGFIKQNNNQNQPAIKSTESASMKTCNNRSSRGSPASSKPTSRNAKGEITTWNGSSDDAKNLRHFVSSGQLDGMKPKEIREKYSDFKKYAYQTFAGALQNIRNSHNKTIYDRSNLSRKW